MRTRDTEKYDVAVYHMPGSLQLEEGKNRCFVVYLAASLVAAAEDLFKVCESGVYVDETKSQ